MIVCLLYAREITSCACMYMNCEYNTMIIMYCILKLNLICRCYYTISLVISCFDLNSEYLGFFPTSNASMCAIGQFMFKISFVIPIN